MGQRNFDILVFVIVILLRILASVKLQTPAWLEQLVEMQIEIVNLMLFNMLYQIYNNVDCESESVSESVIVNLIDLLIISVILILLMTSMYLVNTALTFGSSCAFRPETSSF